MKFCNVPAFLGLLTGLLTVLGLVAVAQARVSPSASQWLEEEAQLSIGLESPVLEGFLGLEAEMVDSSDSGAVL